MIDKRKKSNYLDYQLAEEIFSNTLKKKPDNQLAYLHKKCANNPVLLAYIHELLTLKNDQTGISTNNVTSEALAMLDDAQEKIIIDKPYGAYKLLYKLGFGGMGSVFVAERSDNQYHKQVAIKIINQRHDSNLQKWFLNERQILANLEHPNICRLLDGNTDTDNHPYLVMEFIEGIAITEHCDQKKHSIDQRLQLFLTLCDAVTYAHQKLIVHRDIKPSNILITTQGDLKLMDFGIAQLLGPKRPQNQKKALGPAPISPTYASPEQIKGKIASVQCDVYSLGVLLHRLLYGVLPTRNTNFSELYIAPPPSEQAKRCSMSSNALYKKLQPELQYIITTALSYQPKKRYLSVAELADDIRAYLEHRPLKNHTSSWAHRTQKYIKRHTFQVTTIGIIIACIVGLTTTMAIYNNRLGKERDVAISEQRKAQAATRFIVDIFQSADPENAFGADMTAKEILNIGASQAGNQAPALQAVILQIIGVAYRNLGLYEQSQQYLSQAQSLNEQLYPGDSPELAAINTELAELFLSMEQFEAAKQLVNSSFLTNRKHFGENHPTVARNLVQLSHLNINTSNFKIGEQQIQQAVTIMTQAGDDYYLELAQYMNYLAIANIEMNNSAKSNDILQQALAIFNQHTTTVHPIRGETLQLLGVSQRSIGEYTEALSYFQEALSIRKKIYGKQHPIIALSMNNIGLALQYNGEPEKARPYFENALKIRKQYYGSTHSETVEAFNNLAYYHLDNNEFNEAEKLFRQALEGAYVAFGPDHFHLGIFMTNLSSVLQKLKRIDEACTLAQKASNHLEQRLEPFHWRTAITHSVLGACLSKQGSTQQGLELMTHAYQQLVSSLGENSNYTQEAYQRLNNIH